MEEIILDNDEKDVLQELINIAYGSATSLVADMLQAFASMSIPNVSVLNIPELSEEFKKLKQTSYFFSTQSFIGEFSGETSFFIDNESAKNLAKHLGEDIGENLDEVILEITNILTSSLVSSFAQEVDARISFSSPTISKVPLSDLTDSKLFNPFTKVILIDTEIKFKDQKIYGKIFILTKDESIKWLKKQLQGIISSLI